MGRFIIHILHLILFGDYIKEDEMGRVWRNSEVHTKYWSENLEGRSHMGDLTID
jgi:hypothetical protein